jgi:phosphate transport system substrate-binding protein
MTSLPLRQLVLALLAACASGSASADAARGAGATFPAPVYDAWAAAYARERGVAIRYDAVGSGQGVTLVAQGQVDFGGSDAPLSPADLARLGLRQIPTVIGAVVPVVNLAGIAPGALVLDAATLSAIYRGHIVNWRDPAIAALNPALRLPDARITVVHRADASGTTYLWSRWLSDADAPWRDELGSGTTLAWPTGAQGLGNEGVASLVQRTRSSIGYVAFAYARRHRLSDVALPSHDGAIVRASPATFAAAVSAAPWRVEADLAQSLVGEPGANSWPLIGASFVLLPAPARDAGQRTREAVRFFSWGLRSGARLADDLGYVALPEAAVRLVGGVLAAGTPGAPAERPPVSDSGSLPRSGPDQLAAAGAQALTTERPASAPTP